MRSTFYATAASLILVGTMSAHGAEFDGAYGFKIKTTRGSCTASSGTVSIENHKISGQLKSDGQTFKISGKVKDDGSIKGRISGGVATFKGSFNNRKASATWRNRFGCAGEILFR